MFEEVYIIHKNKREQYLHIQKNRIDLYFKYNLNDYHSIKITATEKISTGDYFIDGYINGNKKYYFKALINSSDNYQFNGDINYDPKTLGKLFKHEDPVNELTPNDIIKKEKLKKKDYEADPPIIWGF
ncbi:DUF1433 domain-containing protein [Staphylococcus gallinarum]|uniref:DUF1433 domain-containing protein n=1 Tax=Staphylococcus gallinarum TaxID=1293 RepID=UPI001E3B12FC|nr:DUF1433 domain-containing protein [Staphylococcus gallinarum]